MNAILNRKYTDSETQGRLIVMNDIDLLFTCYTLELPWLNNKHDVSCIPKGTYQVEKYNSPNKGMVFLLQDVLDRLSIEIHSGNFTSDTHGCILVGSLFEDINNDGNLDVIESRKTLDRLLGILPDNFKLTII
jgi:Family of unknown function (DUF5675)